MFRFIIGPGLTRGHLLKTSEKKISYKKLQSDILKIDEKSSNQGGITFFSKNHDGRILNFFSNNFLGLSNHPAIVEAMTKYQERYGSGLNSVRFICGSQCIQRHLEEKIAEFHNREDAILYPSSFDANGVIFEILLTEDDAVFSDELNQSSIHDGIRLCKARKYQYKHRNMADLERLLQVEDQARIRLIATDGIFSLNGDITPLPEICNLSNKYDAVIFLDDCLATGFFGKSGRGTEEYFGLLDNVDIINSTFGTALGGPSSGYTVGPNEIVALLRQKSRPYFFLKSPSPAEIGAALGAIQLLMCDTSLIKKINHNTELFREGMTKIGFRISGHKDHPICPIILGDEQLSLQFADEMLFRGIYVVSFHHPLVPKTKARVVVQISAMHSEDDIDRALRTFQEVGRELQVI